MLTLQLLTQLALRRAARDALRRCAALKRKALEALGLEEPKPVENPWQSLGFHRIYAVANWETMVCWRKNKHGISWTLIIMIIDVHEFPEAYPLANIGFNS